LPFPFFCSLNRNCGLRSVLPNPSYELIVSFCDPDKLAINLLPRCAFKRLPHSSIQLPFPLSPEIAVKLLITNPVVFNLFLKFFFLCKTRQLFLTRVPSSFPDTLFSIFSFLSPWRFFYETAVTHLLLFPSSFPYVSLFVKISKSRAFFISRQLPCTPLPLRRCSCRSLGTRAFYVCSIFFPPSTVRTEF